MRLTLPVSAQLRYVDLQLAVPCCHLNTTVSHRFSSQRFGPPVIRWCFAGHSTRHYGTERRGQAELYHVYPLARSFYD